MNLQETSTKKLKYWRIERKIPQELAAAKKKHIQRCRWRCSNRYGENAENRWPSENRSTKSSPFNEMNSLATCNVEVSALTCTSNHWNYSRRPSNNTKQKLSHVQTTLSKLLRSWGRIWRYWEEIQEIEQWLADYNMEVAFKYKACFQLICWNTISQSKKLLNWSHQALQQ